jgi:hypothetical protein
MLGIILWYVVTLVVMSSFFSWKNYFYNRKIYKRLSKMVFVDADNCIRGYLDKQEYAIFYYWKDSDSFTLDANNNVFLHKTALWFIPYNLYWYYRYKQFILKQKTYTFKEYYDNKEKLFLFSKRENLLDKILNS